MVLNKQEYKHTHSSHIFLLSQNISERTVALLGLAQERGSGDAGGLITNITSLSICPARHFASPQYLAYKQSQFKIKHLHQKAGDKQDRMCLFCFGLVAWEGRVWGLIHWGDVASEQAPTAWAVSSPPSQPP